MSICAADMRSCDKKAKCLFGPNEGQAYNPKAPCCGMGLFDSASCDCIPATAWKRLGASWSIHTTGTGFYSSMDSYTQPGWYNGFQAGSVSFPDDRFAYIHSEYFSSSKASIGCGYDPENQNGVWQIDYTLSDSGAGLIGLENDTHRTSCVWPEYCQILNYTCSDYSQGVRGSITYTITGYMTGTREEVDPTTGGTVSKLYRLFDNMDLNDPYKGPAYVSNNIAGIPMFEGENVGSFFSNDCECLGYSNPDN